MKRRAAALVPERTLEAPANSRQSKEELRGLLAASPKAFAREADVCLGAREFQRRKTLVFGPKAAAMGDLALEDNVYFFRGDLDVTGTLTDHSEYSLLVVAGTMRAKNLIEFSNIVVGGDLHLEGILYANSSCDRSTYVGGNLSAFAVIENGHAITAKTSSVQHAFSLMNAVTLGRKGVPRFRGADSLLFDASVLDAKGRLDEERVVAAVRGGHPVVRADAPRTNDVGRGRR